MPPLALPAFLSRWYRNDRQETLERSERMKDEDEEKLKLAIERAGGFHADPRWGRFEPALERETAGTNHVWQGDFEDIGRIRAVVCFPGQRGDYALSKIGLSNLFAAREADKITFGLVVLRQGNRNAAETITKVWPKFRGAFWYDYGKGEFAWANERFEPASPSGSRYIVDPDAPM